MSSKSCARAAGFTLVEMVIAIVIISVGLAGVLLAFNTAVKPSADPLIHKQMLAVAEEMLEEVLLKPFAPPQDNDFKPTNAATNCGTVAAARTKFDDVSDYKDYATNSVCDIDGASVSGLEDYSLKVIVDSASLGDAASGILDGGKVKKITVTVRHGSGSEAIVLNGWRTSYACQSGTTGCP